MKNSLLTLAALAALILTGCNSVSEQITAAAGGKNLALDGYVMYGSIEAAVEAMKRLGGMKPTTFYRKVKEYENS